ncbi:hypothetical protein DENSPDRAFT_855310 [Dentipellis sp. KUC8613]|nr:hypothetical protein DENSPDRAFT_855310 [Dentipellis sp. KUC8613]
MPLGFPPEDIEEWCDFVVAQIIQLDYKVKMHVARVLHPLNWTPAAPSECGMTKKDKGEFLKTLSRAAGYVKTVDVFMELEDDFDLPETPASHLRPEWAVWNSSEPWVPEKFFWERTYLEELQAWFSSMSTTDDIRFIGLTRMSEMLLAYGMLLREVFLSRNACSVLGEFTEEAWTDNALGYRFPPHLIGEISDAVEWTVEGLQDYSPTWRKMMEAEVKSQDELAKMVSSSAKQALVASAVKSSITMPKGRPPLLMKTVAVGQVVTPRPGKTGKTPVRSLAPLRTRPPTKQAARSPGKTNLLVKQVGQSTSEAEKQLGVPPSMQKRSLPPLLLKRSVTRANGTGTMPPMAGMEHKRKHDGTSGATTPASKKVRFGDGTSGGGAPMSAS